MYDVFISYSHEDRKRIDPLVDLLVEQRGWSIWFDEELRAGDQFPQVIQKTLEQVRCVLVVWSQHAIGSQWVIAEASEGWHRGILVPLRLDHSEPPLPFRQTEATDFSDWKGAAGAPSVLKLIEAINRAIQSGTPPDESELLAREERRRAYVRRRLMRRAIAGGAAIALIVAGWFGWQQLQYRAAAERLADRAAQLQAEVTHLNDEDRGRTWGSVLLASTERLDKLELATLLAAEAMRRDRTGRTEEVLENLLAMSPWSDQDLKLEHEIHSVQFNTDGTVLVAGGGQGDTLVWNRLTNALTHIPHGGMGDAVAWQDRRGRLVYRGGSTIAIEASGLRVATAGPDNTAAIWDAKTGKELLRLPHETTVTALTFVPRTNTLATVSENGIVRIWDISSGKELRQMEQRGTSYWIAASDSGHYVVSSSGQTLSIWDSGTGAEQARLQHTGPVSAARFSVDETQLVTFGDHIETTVWELPAGKIRKRIPVSAGERAGALFSRDGRTLIIGSTEGALRWWNLDRNEEQFSTTVGQYVFELASSAGHERFVAAGNPDNIASTWDLTSGHELRQMPYPSRLSAVAISPDGSVMASSGFDLNDYLLEATEVRSNYLLDTACHRVHRNLTRNEWREYVGAGDIYRATCPQITNSDANEK